MTSAGRITREARSVQNADLPFFRALEVDETDLNRWTGLLLPTNAPYNTRAFEVKIVFPDGYPFNAPEVSFVSRIYHPNVRENGYICLPILAAENWAAGISICQVLSELLFAIDNPDLVNPLRPDLAAQMENDVAAFNVIALAEAEEHGEDRPVE